MLHFGSAVPEVFRNAAGTADRCRMDRCKESYVHATENREECTFPGERVTIKGEMISVKVGV